jgi:hypothetical protein
MIPILYEVLEHYAKTYKPQVYMEIGVREGDSLMSVLSVHSPELLVLCDQWGPHYGGSNRQSHRHIETLLESVSYPYSVLFYDGDSKQTVPTIKVLPDMVLIDGDHSYAGCMADLINVWSIIPDKSLVLVDDITHPAHTDLKQCVLDFVAKHDDAVIKEMLYDRQGVAVIQKESI